MTRVARMLVGIFQDGKLEWHLPSGPGGYATFCGLDGEDALAGQRFAREQTPSNQKATCVQCALQWRHAISLRLKDSDFEVPT